MKKYTIKQLISGLLSALVVLGSLPVPVVFAQDGLAVETPTPAATSATSPVPSVPQVSVDPTLMPSPIVDESAGTSANFKPRAFVQQLIKRSFQAKEEVQLVVKNAGKDDLTVSIDGGRVEPDIEKSSINGDTIFTIHPAASFKPGKYTVKVVDNTSNQVLSTQQFTWGVLAINTDKSIYLPGEKANIAMAVLDEGGNMVCTAHVNLEIISPNGTSTTLSTDDGSITVNPECRIHNFTIKPDYEASYKVQETGRYVTTLTATTQKGSYTIKDRFEVRDSVPFDVTRDTATRVYPADVYPVRLNVTANEDFTGKIVETVPTDFQISQMTDAGVLAYAQENDIPQNVAKDKNAAIPNIRLPFNGNYPVTLGFGQQIDDPADRNVYKQSGLDGHDGIDFGVPENTPILAVDSGKVILAQEKWIYGTSVVIQHSWGRTYYGHLSKLTVTEGQHVSAGDQIGLSGHTGLATGPHLHFGMKPNDSDINNLYFGKIDPSPYFGISSEDPVLSVSDYPGSTKALVWNVHIDKGMSVTLGYQYKAPNKSPNFYTIGPLQFISSEVPAEQQAKFDVKGNGFVLGDATASASLVTSDPSASSSADDIQWVKQPATQPQDIVTAVLFEEIRPWQLAIDAATTIIITSSYTDPCGSNCWTVPSDWNNSNNTIEVVGPGGNGVTSTTLPGGGGGGGGYAAKPIATTTSFTPGASVSFQIGTGGSGSATWFSTSAYLSAAAGSNASGRTGGAGGAGSGTAATTKFTGGTGGSGGNLAGAGGGGGAGAAGPNGNGGNGGSGVATASSGGGGGGGNGGGTGGASATGTNGANGGNGSGGTGGGTGGTGVGGNGTTGTGGGGAGGAGNSGGAASSAGFGSAGTEMAGGATGTGGAGGGGGGSARTAGSGNNAGIGGAPINDSGAGGGGGGDCTDSGCTEGTGRTGSNGFIVITYTPLITGPTLDQLMRHGDWFSSGVRKSFTF